MSSNGTAEELAEALQRTQQRNLALARDYDVAVQRYGIGKEALRQIQQIASPRFSTPIDLRKQMDDIVRAAGLALKAMGE